MLWITGSRTSSVNDGGPFPSKAGGPRGCVVRSLASVFPGNEGAVSALTLVGREHELALIEDRLVQAGDQGGALVVRGEPGVGKSSLLEVARRTASDRGLATLMTAGFQSEAHVAFAGLHRLLRPVLGSLARLPAPQRAAIQAAFGLQDEAAPDLFLIALAALDLLSEMAAATPLLLVIDDAQLLDVATCNVLMFVARRLEFEPIVMLLAVRDGSAPWIEQAGLPEFRLEPLDEASSAALLDIGAPGLALGLRRRILAEALGNPLALVELPRAVASGFYSTADTPLPLTELLERAFAARLSGLPAAVRTLLLVAALDDGGDQERIVDAASMLDEQAGHGSGLAELAEAQAAGAVKVDGDGLRFRHPLVRSAVYQRSLAPERRAVHKALARVYRGDPDRGLWHLAASLADPDNRVSVELEAMADRAARRGGAAVALLALERAARLATDDIRRGPLLLRAAWLAYELGDLDASSALVRDAQRLKLARREQTMLRYMLELGQEITWPGTAEIRNLVEIAGQLHAVAETDRALDALGVASRRCWRWNPDQETRDLVLAAAERLPVPDSDPRLLTILAQADPVNRGSTVIDRITRLTPDVSDPAGMHLIGVAANAVWAHDIGLAFLTVAVDGLRGQGRLRLLAQALSAQAWAAVHQAREPLAVSAAEEGMALARETGQIEWIVAAQLAKAAIAAERGDLRVVDVLTSEAEALILPLGATPMLALVQFVRGRGAVAHQHYAEGLEHLRRTLDPADAVYHPFIGAWGLSDLVEAAAHTGQYDTADSYLGQLESLAVQTSGPLLRAAAGYARPMVASDDAAEALYQRALGGDLANWPCYRGRMLLWYGRWLRRQRRPADSRKPLRMALDCFQALAFPELAETARQELRASGEKPNHDLPEAWAQLTPQELQIAQLAAAGETNRKIGEQLFLSPRTVQSHLYRAFPKLGITARNQLRDAFT
jgi:DNA-binding CsgD family transcriptional regulator